jgi:hypothetical protein
MLLNDNSVAYLHQANSASKTQGARVQSGVQKCNDVAASVSADLLRASSSGANRSVDAVSVDAVHGARSVVPVYHAHPVHVQDHLLPDNFVIDTGAAIALAGLRPLTDVDLVLDKRASAVGVGRGARLLLDSCGEGRQRSKACRHTYGSHGPDTVWFAFHKVGSAAELVHDPSLHAYCFGLKFVVPRQVLAYKQRRLAAAAKLVAGRHQKSQSAKKDAKDVAYLTALLEACRASAEQRQHHPFSGFCGANCSTKQTRQCGRWEGRNYTYEGAPNMQPVSQFICRVSRCFSLP